MLWLWLLLWLWLWLLLSLLPPAGEGARRADGGKFWLWLCLASDIKTQQPAHERYVDEMIASSAAYAAPTFFAACLRAGMKYTSRPITANTPPSAQTPFQPYRVHAIVLSTEPLAPPMK